jgi:hypothetical protein
VVGKVELAGRDFYYPTNSRDGSIFAVSADGYVFKLEVGGE